MTLLSAAISLSLGGCEQLEVKADTTHLTLNTLSGWMEADIG